MDQRHGQRCLARARIATKKHDTFISEKRSRMDSKFIGAVIENLGQQLPFQHNGKFVGRAGQDPVEIPKQVNPPLALDDPEQNVGSLSFNLEMAKCGIAGKARAAG
ncbi:hypothetical protein AJ88_15340 [Mesorhizobium amorphae CCBAU 01583]|nr:hypothetical protein AJ88_15340 [Mesorhizobium amorphae CCBAU 01583]